MFPIYVAEFEVDRGSGDKRTFNVVMDAHDGDVSEFPYSKRPSSNS